MAKKKQLKILCMALVLITGLYAVISVYGNRQEDNESSQIKVTNLTESEIIGITYKDRFESFSFEKTDDEWEYAKDENFPLNESYISDIVSQVCGITAQRELTGFDELSDYGLDDPAYTVTVTDSDGTTTEITYGDMTDSGYYYVTADGGKSIYVTGSSLPDSLSVNEAEFMQLETFPSVDSSNIVSLKIKEQGEVVYECSDDEDETLQEYAAELSYVALQDCVSYNASDSELAKYGLDENSRKTITVKYKNSGEKQTVTFYMSDAISSGTAADSETANGESADESAADEYIAGTDVADSEMAEIDIADTAEYIYVQLKGSKMIYRLDAADFERFAG